MGITQHLFWPRTDILTPCTIGTGQSTRHRVARRQITARRITGEREWGEYGEDLDGAGPAAPNGPSARSDATALRTHSALGSVDQRSDLRRTACTRMHPVHQGLAHP